MDRQMKLGEGALRFMAMNGNEPSKRKEHLDYTTNTVLTCLVEVGGIISVGTYEAIVLELIFFTKLQCQKGRLSKYRFSST